MSNLLQRKPSQCYRICRAGEQKIERISASWKPLMGPCRRDNGLGVQRFCLPADGLLRPLTEIPNIEYTTNFRNKPRNNWKQIHTSRAKVINLYIKQNNVIIKMFDRVK